MMNRKISASLCVLLLLCSCSQVGDSCTQEPELEEICRIQDVGTMARKPVSLAVTADGDFVLSDMVDVYLYSSDGTFRSKIGNSGRAWGEYNSPDMVRMDGDTVYVWSSMTLKFISYALDGTPLNEYPYMSAISDFCVAGGRICIYTAGLATGRVVEVYDMATGSVAGRFGTPSQEHLALIHGWASAPMCWHDGKFMYCQKNSLQVFSCNDEGEVADKEPLRPESFLSEKVKSVDDLESSRSKMSEYLRNNSMTLKLLPDGDSGFLVLTLEGRAKYVDGRNDNSARAICLYRVSGDSCSVVGRYPYGYFDTQLLYCSRGADLYVIAHEVNGEEESYVIKKLNYHYE